MYQVEEHNYLINDSISLFCGFSETQTWVKFEFHTHK